MAKLMIQVGGTRDGSDPYLSVANASAWISCLVESHSFLAVRKSKSWGQFDREIAVSDPTDFTVVMAAITQVLYETRPEKYIVLTGFETSAPAVAQTLHRLVSDGVRPPLFTAPTKGLQRELLRDYAPHIVQPRFAISNTIDGIVHSASEVGLPAVVKPTNAGGGLGVELVNDAGDLADIQGRLRQLRNYGGTAIADFIVEAFVPGTEYSVQGYVINGESHVTSLCRKIIVPSLDSLGIRGFREVGHVAIGVADAKVRTFAASIVGAFRYDNGPFHIDYIDAGGELNFIEAGFRLPGLGVTELSFLVSGVALAPLSFAIAAREALPLPMVSRAKCAGRCALRSERSLHLAEEAAKHATTTAIKAFEVRKPSSAETTYHSEQLNALESDLARHFGVLASVHVEGDNPVVVFKILADIANAEQSLLDENVSMGDLVIGAAACAG